jgi:NAD(P)-dependent dehydrogenase (short-subunit alcohol dehydrogenase family)
MAARVQDKVAIVTGAGAGMGRATACLLAAEGAKVVIAEWNEAAAVGTRELIEEAGGTAAEIVLDVSTPENAQAMVSFAVERFGGLDILHNQIFAIESGLIEYITPEGWNLVLQNTLTATFLGIKYALPVMKRGGGGSIINTASVAGFTVDPGLAAYGAAKAGVINLTMHAAVEYGRHGIRVNAISPGTTESDAFLQTFGESTTATILRAAPTPTPPEMRTPEALQALRRGMAEATAIKRITQPAEIANVVLFLASDESSTITGANIVADGGVSPRIKFPSLVGAD